MDVVVVVVDGPFGRGGPGDVAYWLWRALKAATQGGHDVAASNLLCSRKNVALSGDAEADSHHSCAGHQDVSGGVGLLTAQGTPGGLTFGVPALRADRRWVAADLVQELR